MVNTVQQCTAFEAVHIYRNAVNTLSTKEKYRLEGDALKSGVKSLEFGWLAAAKCPG